MRTEFISVKSAVNEFIKFTGHEGELDKKSLISWAHDAAARIMTDEQLIHKIVLLPVRDYKARLPEGFKFVIQAAYREEAQVLCSREAVSEYTQKILGTECEIKVECSECGSLSTCGCGQPIVEVDIDRLWRSSNPQYTAAYAKHFYSYGTMAERKTCTYHPEFALMRHTTSSFFNVPYHINECLNLNLDCKVEYSIDLPNIITTFKEGEILLSYFSTVMDDEGYFMIPNDPSVIKAISYAMAEQWWYIKASKSGNQSDRVMWERHIQLAEQWIGRAKSKLQQPDADEFKNFVMSFIHRVLPYYTHEQELYRSYKAPIHQYPNESYNMGGFKS